MAFVQKLGAKSIPSQKDGLKLVVFDFDQTLSAIHVFKTLSGWSKDGSVSIPPPFATTERGQVQRISELSEVPLFKEVGGFPTVAFGGDSRVEGVRQMLERLRARDVEMMILTKGLVGVARKILLDLGLLDFFSDIYGNVGDNYGETSYDKAISRSKPTPQDLLFMSSQEKALSRSKDKFIQQIALREGLSRDQVCLVEDDPEEIRRANPICRTIYVKDGQGMTSRECGTLLEMAEGRSVRSAGRQDDELYRGARSDSRPLRLQVKEQRRGSRAESNPVRANMESRQRDICDSKGDPDKRRFEVPPLEVNSSNANHHNLENEGSSFQQEISKLSLEDPCRQQRRAKSSVDAARNRRPASRGHSRGAFQVAAAKMLDGHA